MRFIPDDGSEPVELDPSKINRLVEAKLPDSWVGPAPKAGLLGNKAGEQYLELLAKNRTSRRGAFEELFRPELSDLPVVGVAEVPYLLGVASTARKLSKGEEVDDESLINLNFYLETAKRKENATLGSKVVDVVQQSLSLGAEMAATTALFGAGLAATATGAGAPVGAGAMGLGAAIGAKTAAKAAATKTARLAIAQMVRRVAGKSASKLAKNVMTSSMRGQAAHQALGEALEKGTYNFAKKFAGEKTATVLSKIAKVGGDLESRGLVGMLLNPARDAQNYAHRRLNDALAGGDETVAMSIAKAFLDTNIEVASEFSGEYLGKIAAKFTSPKMKKLMAQASVAGWLANKTKSPTAQALSGAYKAFGIGSTLEEMSEERVGGFLKGLFGVEGEAGLVNAFRNAGWKDGEQFATEAIAFSIMPILAHGVNRVSGGQSYSEQARAMNLFKDVGLPDPDIVAKTPEQMKDDARKLDKALRDEEEFWFSNTPFRFLEKVLGTKRRGSVASLFQGLGLANMRAVHDLALKKNPENPEAGIDAIADYLTNLQAVQTRGINTPADAEAFNAGVKNGDISINRSTGVAWVTKQSMTKPEIEALAKQTGISYMVPIDEMDDKARIGEITIPDQGPAWDDLPAEQKKTLSIRWGTTDQAALKEKHDFLRKIIPLSKAKTSHESIPVLVSATADQWESETGYPLPEGAVAQGKNDNGEDFYVFHARGMTSSDGETIDLSTKADIGDITEENIEAAMKQTNGIELSPEMNAWIDKRYSELSEKETPTKEEKTLLGFIKPGNKQGRFEFLVKSYEANALGYQTHSTVGIRLLPFRKQEIPREVDMQIRAIVGQDLLDAMAYVPMAKPVASEAYTAVVDAITSPAEAGRAEKLRAAVDKAAEGATVNKLKALLEGDMRKKETVDAIIALLNKETFSLESVDVGGKGALGKAFKAMKSKRRVKVGKKASSPDDQDIPRVKVYGNSLKKPANLLANMQQDMSVVAGRMGETVDMDADPFMEAQRLLKVAVDRRDGENARRIGKYLWIQLPAAKDVTPRNESGIQEDYAVNPAASREQSTAEPRDIEESSPGRTLTMYGASMRRDYWETTGDMDVDDFAPVFGEEEIRTALPQEVIDAAPEAEKQGDPEFLNRIIENIDQINPMDTAKQTLAFLGVTEGKDLEQRVEKLAQGIAFVKAKILKGDRLYDPSVRSMERTVNVKKSASTAGKRMLTARATTSKPFSPEDTQSMLPVKSEEIADAEREEIETALAQADESFNPEQKAPEQKMLQKTPPRDASAMEPLDNRPIGQQLRRIIAYGGQAISRVAQYIYHGRESYIEFVDRLLIPPTSNEMKGMKNGMRWEKNPDGKGMRPVFANGAAWVSHMGRNLLPSHSVENIPLLSRGKDAILNEELDAEGVIVVVDNSDFSVEAELGLPLERLIHASRNGMYPTGRAYARWRKVPAEGSLDENGQPRKVSPSNTYRLVRETDVNDVLSEIDQPVARVDFFSTPEGFTMKKDIIAALRKRGATEEQIKERFERQLMAPAQAPLDTDVNQQVHRAAVLPLSASLLEKAGATNEKGEPTEEASALINGIGLSLHNFMVKNRVRNVILAGMDQIEDAVGKDGKAETITWKSENGDTFIMPKRLLVPGEWEAGLRKVLVNAFGDLRKKRKDVDVLSKQKITPGTKKAIKRARKAALESGVPIREDALLKAPKRPGEEDIPDTNETFSLLAVDQKLISNSMQAAQDLVRRMEEMTKVPPMPDEWHSIDGHHYEKQSDGSWHAWNGAKSMLSSPEDVLVLSEKEAQMEWNWNPMKSRLDYSAVAQIVEEWKEANGIVYDPREAYAKGEGFFHDIGAFNPKAKTFFSRLGSVLLRQSRALRKGEVKYWQNPENQVVVSGYTHRVKTPASRDYRNEPEYVELAKVYDWFQDRDLNEFGQFATIEETPDFVFAYFESYDPDVRDRYSRNPSQIYVEMRSQINSDEMEYTVEAGSPEKGTPRPGSGPRFVIRPSWQDIVWAAVGDVYSGTVQENKEYQTRATGFSTKQEAEDFIANPPEIFKGKTLELSADEERGWEVWDASSGIRVDPKAPQASKLKLLSNSIAAAIEGRLPDHYNELGIRLRLGNFYIEGEGSKWTAEYNPNMVGGPRWVLRNSEGLLTGKDFATEAEALAAVEDLSGIPPELRRLNKFLKQAFERVHGSLDAVSPYEPKTIKRASGVAETFSMEPLSLKDSKKLENRMLAGVKRFNNNRYIPPDEMSVYRGRIRKALNGDDSGKRWLARNLGKADQEAFKGFLPTPEPIGAPGGLPVAPEGIQEANIPEAGQMDLFTYSMEPLQDMIDTMAPQYRSGSPGMHKLFLNLSHNLKAVQFERTKEVENLRYKLGLLGSQKNLPDGHKKQVEDVLTAIGAKLDGSERIPIGWNEQGEVEWLARSPQDIMDDWDTYRETNGILEMPTADDLLIDLRGRFDAVRQEFNKLVEDFSDEEWIRYLNEYLPHIYAFRNIEQRDNFIRSMREQSARALKRTFETYQRAAEVKNLVPKTMNALDLFQIYNETVWNAAKNRVLVNTASLIRDIDGAPMVIPVKLGGDQTTKNSLVSPEVLRQTARHLADFLGATYDPSKDPAQEIERLVGMLDVSGNDYERMDSPLTKSVDYFIVRKGTPSNLLKLVLGYGKLDNQLVNAISAYNNWSKFLMLGMSAFHPFALAESMVATFGITTRNPAFHWLKTKRDLAAIVKEMRENPEKYAHWVRRGLEIPTTSPDVQMSRIAKDIEGGILRLQATDGYAKKVLIPGLKALRWYKNKVDLWLWNQFQPSMKLYGADFLMNEWEGQHPTATEAEREEAGEAIARHINKAFGGIDWMEYTWASPRALQLLHMGIFAPDWTMAAAEISGATRLPILSRMHRMELTPLEKNLALRKYWPAMIGIVLLGLPNMVQAAIYAAFGDPDDDDVPFNFMNEAGKQTAIDFTPIFRHLPGYDGGDSGKRRVFMRWGKQAYEVSEGWFGDPAMLLRKSSSAVRQAFEQVTGSSPTGWDLPFKGEGLVGLVAGKENRMTSRFMGSRVGNIVKNFVPISVQSAVKGEYTSFIAPSSKGATMGKMITEMKEAMTDYVESYDSPTRIDLEAAVADQMDALRRNGYDPSSAVQTAKRSVMSLYYRKFFEALNSGNDSELEAVAQKVLILGGTFRQAMASIESRMKTVGQPVTDEILAKVRQALMKHEGHL